MGFIGQLAKIFGTVAVLQKCFLSAGARWQASTVLGCDRNVSVHFSLVAKHCQFYKLTESAILPFCTDTFYPQQLDFVLRKNIFTV